MGTQKCCVGGCNATSETHRLFSFPKNDYLRNQWMSFLVPTNSSLLGLSKEQLLRKRVCEKHFDRHQFDINGRRLRYSYPCLLTNAEIAHGVPLFGATGWDITLDHNYFKEQAEEAADTHSCIKETGDHKYCMEQVDTNIKTSGTVMLGSADTETNLPSCSQHPTVYSNIEHRDVLLEKPSCSGSNVEKESEIIQPAIPPTQNKYAVDFLVRQAIGLGLPYSVYYPEGLPIFVATWKGSDPSLPSIMLNSHMDVVPADKSEWVHPPFEAFMDIKGDIYGRGTQDTKDVTIQYFEAIKILRKDNVTLARTVHLTVMADEEQGGEYGIKAFVKTSEFKALNIGFALDEGLASKNGTLFATYVDRRPWQMKFVVHGKGGHGLAMPNESAMEKAQRLINAVMAYRERQKEKMQSKSRYEFGELTSVNINMMNGGLAPNIIPTSISLVVDMRLSTSADTQEVQALVDSWIHEAGENTEVTYLRQVTESAATAVNESNPYWVSMRNTLNKMGEQIIPVVCPATSDMLVLRNLGIPAIGFTTKTYTKPRLHSKDEYQNVLTFLLGISVYTELIKGLGNVPPELPYQNCNTV